MPSARNPIFGQPNGEGVKAGCFGGEEDGPGSPATACELETEVGGGKN